MGKEACTKLEEVISRMNFNGTAKECYYFENGHINDTFAVLCEDETGRETKYLLQRINHLVFKDPLSLMNNIIGVTSFLREKIIAHGGDPDRETLNIIQTKNGESYYKDSHGNYWRCYLFVDGTVCYDAVEKPNDFYHCGVAFGQYQRLLSDYPAHTLHETIKDFHNTKVRFDRLKKAIDEDKCGRAKNARNEIEFALTRESEAGTLVEMLEKGELPLRVTHNDTKLNNVLFDKKTGSPLCIVDLDTIMPGLSINDFGDAIRYGASTAAEDERDLTKVKLDLDLFDVFTRGFIEGCARSLTEKELDMLPMATKLITLELGTRFLTDYLQGDVYFRISRPEQNLDRCRTQFKLVADMEAKWNQMIEIISRYR